MSGASWSPVCGVGSIPLSHAHCVPSLGVCLCFFGQLTFISTIVWRLFLYPFCQFPKTMAGPNSLHSSTLPPYPELEKQVSQVWGDGIPRSLYPLFFQVYGGRVVWGIFWCRFVLFGLVLLSFIGLTLYQEAYLRQYFITSNSCLSAVFKMSFFPSPFCLSLNQ